MLKKSIEGQPLMEIYREGTEFRYDFAGKNVPGIHFMLRGKLLWIDAKNPQKNALAVAKGVIL